MVFMVQFDPGLWTHGQNLPFFVTDKAFNLALSFGQMALSSYQIVEFGTDLWTDCPLCSSSRIVLLKRFLDWSSNISVLL